MVHSTASAKIVPNGNSPMNTVSAMQPIAEAVRRTRQLHGLTQFDLAGLSGTGPRFISELENAKPTVAMNKVLAVLATLGLRLEVREVNSP